MATTPTKPACAGGTGEALEPPPLWGPARMPFATIAAREREAPTTQELRPSRSDALQALLAFSAMHQQVRQRRVLALRNAGFEPTPSADFEGSEQFVLDEVLQLVADRAIAMTGADGLGIALAENNEIVLRASAGGIKPDVGARIQRDSAFSGACFRTSQIIRCDDTETDHRVDLEACRELGARSLLAVPLCGRRRVIGVLEAFSAEPFGFNDSDVDSLQLLAELILGALKPEDEDRFAESALVAEAELSPIESQADSIAESAAISSEQTVASEIFALQRNKVATENASISASSALLEFANAIESRDESPIEDSLPAQVTRHIKLSDEHHPGILLVVFLIVVAVLFAGGMWWKLKTSPFGKSQTANVKFDKLQLQPAKTILAQPAAKASTSAPTITPTPGQSAQGAEATRVESTTSDENTTEYTRKSAAQSTSKLPRITGIRHWASNDSSTVVFDLEDQVQYEAHRLSNPDRIYFDLHDTSLDSALEGQTIEIGDALLERVRVAQPVPGLTRVVLETKNNSNYSVSLEPNPYRLVVLVRKPGADPKARVHPFPDFAQAEREKMAIIVSPPTREDLQLRARVQKMRIVVDAGHGGWDLGTVGRHGLLEKDLALEIAQRLGQLLQSRLGAEVILTRKDDNYIPLDQRAGMANQSQADLFVSVHANYSDLPSARGVETYYTNFFSAPDATNLEPNESDHTNHVSTAVLSPAEMHDKIEQSRRLAASVQRSLYATLSVGNPGLRDRGIKEASYVVLTETAMPGILAEVSFVSSPADEQKLRSDGYREQIAEALYKGIARYATSSHGVKMASAAK